MKSNAVLKGFCLFAFIMCFASCKVELGNAESSDVMFYVNSPYQLETSSPTLITETGVGATVVNKVAAPVFLQSNDVFVSGEKVTVSCATQGAEFFYTKDGSDPDSESNTYPANGITVTKNCVLKVIAVKNGMIDSVIVSKNIEISK